MLCVHAGGAGPRGPALARIGGKVSDSEYENGPLDPIGKPAGQIQRVPYSASRAAGSFPPALESYALSSIAGRRLLLPPVRTGRAANSARHPLELADVGT